jgi:hypothetical protein
MILCVLIDQVTVRAKQHLALLTRQLKESSSCINPDPKNQSRPGSPKSTAVCKTHVVICVFVQLRH